MSILDYLRQVVRRAEEARTLLSERRCPNRKPTFSDELSVGKQGGYLKTNHSLVSKVMKVFHQIIPETEVLEEEEGDEEEEYEDAETQQFEEDDSGSEGNEIRQLMDMTYVLNSDDEDDNPE